MIILRKDKLKLVPDTDPILHKPPTPFDFSDGHIGQRLYNLMSERMKEIGGIGLSANQVGIDARVFIMGVDDLRIGVFNPTIIEYGEEEDSFNEGCLSFPGLSLQVKRPTSIVATYYNEKGEQVTNRFQGLTSRVFQHEYDHMEGKTFQSRVSQLKWNLAIKKRNHIKAKLVKKYTQKTLIDIYNEVKDAENTDRV